MGQAALVPYPKRGRSKMCLGEGPDDVVGKIKGKREPFPPEPGTTLPRLLLAGSHALSFYLIFTWALELSPAWAACKDN